MLDNFILETVANNSYSVEAMNNIKSRSGHLRSIIENKPDFGNTLIGGSYKRGTLVKGISDIDVYVQYTGSDRPSVALGKLKAQLVSSYRDADIRKDKPSILVEFQKIPFNVTPFKRNQNSIMSIPGTDLSHWRPINLEKLEKGVKSLRNFNQQYIDLIKILKIWNGNHKRKLENFNIEEKVVNLFTPLTAYHRNSISDWLLLFFKSNAYSDDSVKFANLKNSKLSEGELRNKWFNYINNQ